MIDTSSRRQPAASTLRPISSAITVSAMGLTAPTSSGLVDLANFTINRFDGISHSGAYRSN